MKPAVKTLFALGLAHMLLECFAGVWPIYKKLAGLDLETAANMASVTMVFASLLQPLFGLWAERGIARGMALAGVALTMVLALAGPAGDWLPTIPGATPGAAALKSPATYFLLGLILLISRLGHAMFHPPSVTLAHQALADRQTAGLGIFVAMGWLGVGFSQYSFSQTFLLTGGHSEWLLIPGFLILAWIALWCQPGQKVEHQKQPLRDKIAELWLLKRSVGSLFAINLMLTMSAAALFFLFPELLAAKHAPRWMVEGGALFLWMLGTTLGVTVGGYAAGRRHSPRLLILSLAINFVAYEGFMLIETDSAFLMGAICTSAGLLTGLCQPLPLALSQTVAPRHASLVGGVLMGWTWALGNLAPSITAPLIKRAGLSIPHALCIMGAANFAAIFFAMFLPTPEPELVVAVKGEA